MKNIAVCVKQTPDTETKIKIKDDKTSIDSTGVKWILSPYDEIAVEEALRLKEKNADSVVTVFSVGPERVKETIRTALAMGADKGVHIDCPENADSIMIAKALAAALKKEGSPDIIFTGKEAIDDGGAQVSHLLGVYLDLPCVSVILNIDYQDGKVVCHREVEGGTLEVIEAKLPAILATQKGLNEPRYASLPNIMKAKKKEITTLKASDLGVSESDQKIAYSDFQLPPPKKQGQILQGTTEEQVKALVKALREEVKVI